MAKTIEELNFQLKVDDKAFKAQMEADKKAAKDLADTVRDYLNIKKAQGTLSAKEYQTLKRLDNLESNRRVNAEKELAAQAKRLAAEERLSQVKEKNNQYQERHNRLIREAASIATSYLSIWGAKKLLSELVAVTGEFEMQRTTLKAMLQDANGANAIYEQIKQLAVVSPFGFKELVTYTKQLAAYSVPIGELYDTTKMLADVSAGLGVGMDRLVLAYGQVRSAAFLRGQEVRQFTEAGIPILDMLAKQFEELEGRVVSTGEVFDKISKRLVPFEMVAKAFKDMTSEGGKFFNMQEIQAETLQGKISNLKDAYEIMLNEIGQNLEPVMKGTVDTLRNLMANYEQIGRQILVIAASYGVARTAIMLFTATTGEAIVANSLLFKSLKGISSFVSKNPYALLAAGVAALAGGIYKLATAQNAMEKSMDAVSKSVEKFNAANAEDEMNLRFLVNQLESAKKGTQEYEIAKRQLYSEYGTYISEIDAENIALGKTAEAYKNIVSAIRDAHRESVMSEGLTDIANIYRDEYDSIFKQLRGTLQSMKVDTNGAIAKQLGQYIRGEVDTSALSKEALDVISRVKQSLEAKLKTSGGMFGNGISFYGVDIDRLRENFKHAEDIATDARQDLADELEVIFGPTPKKIVDGGTPEDDPDDKSSAIEVLQKRISLLEKLRDVYESMRPYFSDSQIKDFFASSFGFADKSLWENLDFSEQIDDLLSQLDKLGTEGVEAANNVREKLAVALGKDLVSGAKDEAKKLEDFNKRVEKYIEDAKSKSQKIKDLEAAMASDLAMASTDEQKAAIIAHYTEEIEKLNEELKDITSIQLTDFWQQLTGEKNGTYGNLTRLQKKAEALREAIKGIQEPNRDKNGKITGYTLTQEKNGDVLKSLGIDAEEVQLSVAQVEALNKAIDKLIGKRADKNGIFAFFDAIKDGGFKDFWKQVKEGSGPAMDILKGVDSQLSELGSIFTEIGEATGSDFLTSLGDTFNFVGGFMDKLREGDLLGAVGEVVKVFTSWITASVKLKAAIANAAKESERLNAELKLSAGVDTIFGENALAKMRNAISLMREYGSVVEANRNQANRSITWKSGLFNWGRSSKSLSDMVSELGYGLYDAYGNLNTTALQAILDTYENLTSADRAWIEDAIKNSEIYADAMEQMREVMKDTWGSLASDMADKLITARKEVGDAYHALADDLRVTFGDMADDIAHKLVESFIIDNVLANYEGNLEEIYKMMKNGASEDRIAEAFTTMTDSIIEDSAMAADFTNRIYDALEKYGVAFNESSSNLADGIKGVTEDTANLLASYINAIRADVSYSRVQRDNILAEIKNMASYVASPTLMDYLNRIQANTFDTAQSNQRILTHIESMMTTDSGLTALRVYM